MSDFTHIALPDGTKIYVNDETARTATETNAKNIATNAEAISELNGNIGSIISVFGEIGVDDVAVIYGNVLLQKFAGSKCNLHIECGVDSIVSTSSTDYTVISMDKICSLLGITSIEWSRYEGHVFIIRPGSTTPSSDTLKYGIYFHSGAIHRAFTTDGGLGAWAVTKTEVYEAGNIFCIDVYGATYT